MSLDEMIKKGTSGEIPTVVMAGGAILVLLLALKAARGLMKFIFILGGLGLLAGAVWWHLHKR